MGVIWAIKCALCMHIVHANVIYRHVVTGESYAMSIYNGLPWPLEKGRNALSDTLMNGTVVRIPIISLTRRQGEIKCICYMCWGRVMRWEIRLWDCTRISQSTDTCTPMTILSTLISTPIPSLAWFLTTAVQHRCVCFYVPGDYDPCDPATMTASAVAEYVRSLDVSAAAAGGIR